MSTTTNPQDLIDELTRAISAMTQVALIGEAGDADEDDLRALCSCIAARGAQAQSDLGTQPRVSDLSSASNGQYIHLNGAQT